jgi:hypothetical protein
VEQLIKLTVNHRAKAATLLPKAGRVDHLLQTYPVFKISTGASILENYCGTLVVNVIHIAQGSSYRAKWA